MLANIQLILLVFLLVGCNTCEAGQRLNEHGYCEPCILNCITCRQPFSCEQCNSGFTLNDGQTICKKKSGVALGIAIPFIAIAAGMVFVLCCSMVIACYRRITIRNSYRANLQRQLDNPMPAHEDVFRTRIHYIPRHPNRNRSLFSQNIRHQRPEEIPYNTAPVHFDAEKDTCTICLDGRTDVTTECHHYFHFECLKQWDQRSDECPNCKQEMGRRLMARCSRCGEFTRSIVMCQKRCGMRVHRQCIIPQLAVNC